ncbi:MAG: Ppx/GppA phosphatase family protein [Mariprofundaceae bacterium]|nr:Ppx/GppA phosphatase family protein [Mariprofundaceae bacterium]
MSTSPATIANTANVLTKPRAVLDIGSNTIRLLIAQTTAQGFKTIHYEHHIARLGEGLQRTGMLGAAGQQRALQVLQQVAHVCQQHHIQVNHIHAVATAAVREASNGADFVHTVQQQTKLIIRIISGQEEAHLALKGATLGLPAAVSQDMLLFDIGGGSTEFTRVKDGQIVDAISLKLGVIRLTEQFLHSDPPSSQHYQVLKQQTQPFISQLEQFWGNNTALPASLVGTAGTVTTLAAIAQDLSHYQAISINGYGLSKVNFMQLKQQLCTQTNQQRLLIPLLEKGREDVIIAGLAIIESLFERWGYQALTAVDSGLLEGLLLQQPSTTTSS